jgi:hypothetical protein
MMLLRVGIVLRRTIRDGYIFIGEKKKKSMIKDIIGYLPPLFFLLTPGINIATGLGCIFCFTENIYNEYIYQLCKDKTLKYNSNEEQIDSYIEEDISEMSREETIEELKKLRSIYVNYNDNPPHIKGRELILSRKINTI